MKKERMIHSVMCFLLGAVLFGGGTAYAAGVFAEPSRNLVYVNGKQVQLEAYLINGANYVKLRDVGQAVGFNVYWDGSVQVDSSRPYTGEAPAEKESGQPGASETCSSQANPEIFTGLYTRELYDAAAAVIAELKNGNEEASAPLTIVDQADRWKIEVALSCMANGYTLSLRDVEGPGAYELYVVKPDRTVARQYTEELIQEVLTLSTDREKVIALNNYLCEKAYYDRYQTPGINTIASAESPVPANCAAFSMAMNDLCRCVGIPCVKVYSADHFWNAVYCDGEWSFVDVSQNALSSTHASALFTQTTRKQIEDPALLLFLKELLVPGSTK